jgi:RimJ/RimL family protein N-acetyltransferase
MAIDERLVFLEGIHVRLKTPSMQDITDSDWVGWFNDETLSSHNQHHYFPNTVERQVELLPSLNTSSKLQLAIIDRTDPERICGMVSLGDINWIHRHAEIAGVQARTRTGANPALFFEAWALVLKHGFEQFGMQKIYGATFHPHVAGALTRMFNFQVEGVRKRHVFKGGVFHDLTVVAVFNDTIKYPEF